jgi:hypothetical protein
MKVRVGQFLVLNAGRACAAGISCFIIVTIVFILAVDKLGISQGQGQFPGSFRPGKKLGVTHAALLYCAYQAPLNIFLSCDIFKKHLLKFVS